MQLLPEQSIPFVRQLYCRTLDAQQCKLLPEQLHIVRPARKAALPDAGYGSSATAARTSQCSSGSWIAGLDAAAVQLLLERAPTHVIH